MTAFESLLESVDPWVRAMARWQVAKMRTILGQGGREVEAQLELALAEFRTLGERFGIYLALSELAGQLAMRGEFGTVAVGGRTGQSATDVMRALQELAAERPVFFKDTMDYRYPDVLADRDFQRAVTHSFMIRPPEAVVASYLRIHARAERDAMGFENLVELYDAVCASTGQEAFVIDGDHLVADPARTVQAYCRHLGLPFRQAALQWQAGALEDWNQFSRWHQKAATTTSFVHTHPKPLPVELRERAEAFVAHHQPFYDRLLTRVRTPGAE